MRREGSIMSNHCILGSTTLDRVRCSAQLLNLTPVLGGGYLSTDNMVHTLALGTVLAGIPVQWGLVRNTNTNKCLAETFL